MFCLIALSFQFIKFLLHKALELAQKITFPKIFIKYFFAKTLYICNGLALKLFKVLYSKHFNNFVW